MAKEMMRRTARDNQYMHRDFHGALSVGIEYLHENFGENAVRRYLWQFAQSYYAPLTQAIKSRGLIALLEHFGRVYHQEGSIARFTLSDCELLIEVETCPAVSHLRNNGFTVARLFRETTDTVNQAICFSTPFAAELVEYHEATGKSIQRFYRSVP